MTDLAARLTHVVHQARAAGMASLDLWTLEALLHEHHQRRDLLRRDDMLIVDLTND
jgi:hypothetical protein